MKTDSQHLRQLFTDFFKNKGHHVVSSSSLVPGNDPTLLFTNAGMVQFKDTFLGTEKRAYNRATTIQRCVRAGGKHNDLDNVGYTARHHTFFEMMGNFSFGDYFKREAIQYAWEFLTDVLKLPKEKLWITIFEEDQEAEAIWLKEIGIDPNRFSRIGAKDNFWSMGDTGPCGPCTEIFYDHGAEIAGGPPGSPDADGDRYIEIWNLVFMQYNRDAAGTLHPLPKPSVDTGMGLERLAAVVQGVHDNYDIDTFKHLIAAVAKLANTQDLHHKSLRVIADHIRSSAFLIVDGVLPSNEGRGYVLRRIIRRAIRHGHQLGVTQAFFSRLVQPLVEVMGKAYPELTKAASNVESILLREEQQFSKTLDQGLLILKESLAKLKGTVIPGETVFKLYDTYGFPVDLTGDIAREHNLTLDIEGFEKCMEQQRERARSAGKFAMDYNATPKVDCDTKFVGYGQLFETAEVESLLHDNTVVKALASGQAGIVVLPVSPFYAESGGQVGDQGVLAFSGGEFVVQDTQKQGNAVLHVGYVQSGELKIGMLVEAHVDETLRRQTAANHSATHLLHAAMQKILGSHVEQKGSLVNAERLRFDFSHHSPLTTQEWVAIEQLVNEQVRANWLVETVVTTPDEAKKMGAMALFGEKYGDQVRVLRMGGFSSELCGGTHVQRTGEIGLFKLVLTGSVASGIRRIEAMTGAGALQWIQETEQLTQSAMSLLNAGRTDLLARIESAMQKQKQLEHEIDQLKSKLAQHAGNELAAHVKNVKDFQVLAAEVPGVDAKALRELVEQWKTKLGRGIVVLASVDQGKVSLVAGVTKDLVAQYSAGDIVGKLAQQVGGKGGGRADLAQAGGVHPERLAQALMGIGSLL